MICFLLLFKEPYKGKDLSARWVLLTVFEKSPNGLFYSLEERKEKSCCLCDCYLPFDHKSLSYRLSPMPYQWIWSLTTAKGFCFVYLNYLFIYYIKVSGIPSGNKLIKTIRYPHMWRYDILTCEDIDNFTDIRFVS